MSMWYTPLLWTGVVANMPQIVTDSFSQPNCIPCPSPILTWQQHLQSWNYSMYCPLNPRWPHTSFSMPLHSELTIPDQLQSVYVIRQLRPYAALTTSRTDMQYFCTWSANGAISRHSNDLDEDTILPELVQLKKATWLSFALLVHTPKKICPLIERNPSNCKLLLTLILQLVNDVLHRWLYATFIALDVNFHLKWHHVSSDIKDPGLSNGWGYFVDDVKYKVYLSTNFSVPQEVSVPLSQDTQADGCQVKHVCQSQCSQHGGYKVLERTCGHWCRGGCSCEAWHEAAMWGWWSSERWTVCHCRHEFMPSYSSVCHCLRYMNMDYIFASALAGSSLMTINMSYDIACQWYKKFWQHMKLLPSILQVDPTMKNLNFVVPKFHLATHIETCQTRFSLN